MYYSLGNSLEIIFPLPQTRSFNLISFRCETWKSKNVTFQKSQKMVCQKRTHCKNFSWHVSIHPNIKKSVIVGKIWKLSFFSRKPGVSISFRLGVREEKVKMSLFKKVTKKCWKWSCQIISIGYTNWCHGKYELWLRTKEATSNIKTWFWYFLSLYEPQKLSLSQPMRSFFPRW